MEILLLGLESEGNMRIVAFRLSSPL